MSKASEAMEKIVALCRRRGFIFGSSEIYGGLGGFWDYGPLGTELKRNIKEAWWNDMVQRPPLGPAGTEYQMVGVDCSIIMNPKVWEASGHVGGFQDPMVDCTACHKRFRADQVWIVGFYKEGEPESPRKLVATAGGGPSFDRSGRSAPPTNTPPIITYAVEGDKREEALEAAGVALSQKQRKLLGEGDTITNASAFTARDVPDSWIRPCPLCHADALTKPRAFNLMFKTYVGAMEDSSSVAYLRPETAQGIFANFKNVCDSTRVKIPFGIAQMGKAFRNEINPRNYTFRSREFEQMEIEFFCKPDTSMMWWEFWRDVRLKWYESLNIRSEKLRPRQQTAEELAHYSEACTDIEYLFPFSEEPQELEGVAHRGCYDLGQHGKFSRGSEDAFAVIDEDTKERFVPHVIEPSAGVDRFALAAITEAYTYDESRASPEFMKFHPRLAPIKAAVFPLVAKDGMPEIAEPIYRDIRKHFPCQYDAKQSIGKRYARMDEAGTPFCFTIDGQTKEDGTVTVRNRDDASQERIDKSRCAGYLRDKLGL